MRTVSDRWGIGLIGVAALLVVVSSVALLASSRELQQAGTALAFAGFVAFGELSRITLPGDREEAPLATAIALAYALLVGGATERATHGVAQVVSVTAVGRLSDWFRTSLPEEAPRGDDVAAPARDRGCRGGIPAAARQQPGSRSLAKLATGAGRRHGRRCGVRRLVRHRARGDRARRPPPATSDVRARGVALRSHPA